MHQATIVLLILLSLVASNAWAFSSTGASCALAWDEDPPPTSAVQYFLYARRAGESYCFVVRQPSGGFPVASAENRPGSIEQTLPCERVVLSGDGRHYLVVTAVAMDLSQESDPSREIWLDVRGGVMVASGASTEETPEPTPEPRPPQIPTVPLVPPEGIVTWKDLKAPPGLIAMPPIVPPSMRGGASLSESCLWNSCEPSALPRVIPPGFGQGGPSLEENEIWNGRRR